MAWFSVLLVFGLFCASADAWGPDGHTIIAHIAEKLLDPEVDAILRSDLGNMSLTDAADWCDSYDHEPDGRWSSKLHFINMPDCVCGGGCVFTWKRDCKKDKCNAGAIVNYTSQVFDPRLSKERRVFALKFVIHMMGDIHQPLHVGRKSDVGGNAIRLTDVHFKKKASAKKHKNELHRVWDSTILIEMMGDLDAKKAPAHGLGSPSKFVPHYHHWSAVVNELVDRMRGKGHHARMHWETPVTNTRNEHALRAGMAVIADEAASRACRYAYRRGDGSEVRSWESLDRAYYLRARPVVEEQLAKGGARLAAILKSALEAARLTTSRNSFLAEEHKDNASDVPVFV